MEKLEIRTISRQTFIANVDTFEPEVINREINNENGNRTIVIGNVIIDKNDISRVVRVVSDTE